MSYYVDSKIALQNIIKLIKSEKSELDKFASNQAKQIDEGIKKHVLLVDQLKKERQIFEAEKVENAKHMELIRKKLDADKAEKVRQIEALQKEAEIKFNTFNQLASERQKGYPLLAKAYEEWLKYQDKSVFEYLNYKKNPAHSSADIVKEQSRLRRESERARKISEGIILYYEEICPFLKDLKEELVDIDVSADETRLGYNDDEKQDAVTQYISIEDYRKLPTAEKNQLALNMYWKRPKSKWQIGRMYERFIGYQYETKGFDVDYVGAIMGLEDLGRDLICRNGKETILIQCKMWSHFKTIYEKHIFQFFGTVFQFKDANKNENVKAMFCTTTKLSDLARRFANELKIDLKEEYAFVQNYPCIKCNISKATKEKIYHLPFDQQYDKVKIEVNTGEFYCSTIKEAEEKGFRRAFRYHGTASK